jgi:septation ring formation regulator EzrA
MKLVTNKLGLTADAAEASVLAAIEAIQNQLTEKESQMEALRTEIADKTNAVNQANEALTAAQEQLNQLKEEKDAADETARVAEATNMIKGYATQGRIKNDDVTLQSWIAKAKDDMAGVKTMLESLPLNKAAVHIAVEPQKGEVATSAASLMAHVMNKTKKK